MSGPTLLLVRARSEVLQRTPDLWPEAEHPIVLGGRAALPWGGCRALLGYALQRLGAEVVDHALTPRLDTLSVVLGGGRPRPSGRPRLPSFLCHNGVVNQPTQDAWVAVLREVLPQLAGPIVIPELSRVDPASLEALRVAWTGLTQRPALRMGHDPEGRPSDLHGRRSHDLIDTEALLFAACAEAQVVEVAGPAPPVPAWHLPPMPTHPLDDGLEIDAARALRGPWSAEAQALGVQACRAAFEARGFAAVLHLGLELLSWARALDESTAAELHTLVALAAYSRQVESGDAELADFLDHHLGAALALETRPASRAFLLQRLGMGAARRRRRFAEALQLLDQGLILIEDPDVPRDLALYLRAWLINARAYALSGLERRTDAAIEARVAWSTLQDIEDEGLLPPRELAASRLVFLDNLATVHGWDGDMAASDRWQDELVRYEATLPVALHLSRHRTLQRISQDPRQVLEAERLADEGLRESIAAGSPLHEDRYAVALGELLYRRGLASRAQACYERALALRLRIGTEEDRFQATVSAALAALRAGAFADCQRHLRRAWSSPLSEAPAVAARLKGLEARSVAADSVGAANGLIEAAIELGLRSRRPAVLLAVALHAAELALLLRQPEAAKEALVRARSMLDGADAGPAERAQVAGGLRLMQALDEPSLCEALQLLPVALQDPEVWWSLPRLLPVARPPPVDEGSWGTILRAAQARPDCAPLLAQMG